MTKERNFDLHDGKFGAAITVRITPRAAKNAVAEILEDGTVRVQLVTATVENQANQSLVELLSTVLQVPPASIEIVAGHNGKDKLVTILGLDSGAVQKKILKVLG
jgi:uncharacterized protein YggU (UPF0235/DUF167 family)